jgi:hypothetical protein
MAVPWVALGSSAIILGTVVAVAKKRSPNPIGRRGGGSWGYSINYDKEIKQDEADIAAYGNDRVRAISASLTDEELDIIKRAYKYDAVDWALRYPDKREARAAILGIPLEDIVCAAETSESLPKDLAVGDPPVNWYRRGEAVYKQLEVDRVDVLPEPLRLKLLRKAKTDLSRHARNQSKFG